jgi:hypothetical protein
MNLDEFLFSKMNRGYNRRENNSDSFLKRNINEYDGNFFSEVND